MLSTTWNAPLEAFTDPDQFFEGKGVHGAFFPFHKSQEFVGLEQVPTFACYDVLKNPDIESVYVEKQRHILWVFPGRTRKAFRVPSRHLSLSLGAACENLHLQAEALGLGTVMLGAFSDNDIKKIIGLKRDLNTIRPFCIMPVGKKQ